MTEEVWLATGDYLRMLHFVHGRTTLRQARLYMSACCRTKEAEFFDARMIGVVDAAERCADEPSAEVVLRAEHHSRLFPDEPPIPELPEWVWLRNAITDATWLYSECVTEEAWDVSRPRFRTPQGAISHALYMSLRESPIEAFTGGEGNAIFYCATNIDRAGVLRLRERPGQSLRAIDDAKEQIQLGLAHLIREIFGNPFRPVAFDPVWRSDTALSLAKHIYESRDFSTMPILADALQDAGCDNADILSHCRDTNQVHVRGCWVVDLVLGKE